MSDQAGNGQRRADPAVALALLSSIALAWLLLAGTFNGRPPAQAAQGMHAAHAAAAPLHAAARAWRVADALAALLMWLAMAVAMMLPTAVPAVLAAANSGSGQRGRSAWRTAGAFAIGYLTVWWAFGIVATVVQWLLSMTVNRVPAAAALAGAAGPCLLILAGLYQFSRLKERCLAHCRGPIAYQRSDRQSRRAPARALGLRHGVHCLGCCWALMALMLLGGAMSIGWTAALAALMLAEKVLPGGARAGRALGAALVGWGVLLLGAA